MLACLFRLFLQLGQDIVDTHMIVAIEILLFHKCRLPLKIALLDRSLETSNPQIVVVTNLQVGGHLVIKGTFYLPANMVSVLLQLAMFTVNEEGRLTCATPYTFITIS